MVSFQRGMVNLGDLCRLCLTKVKVLIPIFEPKGTNDGLSRKISSCLSIKISRTDELPQKICKECLSKVESMYMFWSRAVQSQRQLREWLSDIKKVQGQSKKTSLLILHPSQVQKRPQYQLVVARQSPQASAISLGTLGKREGKARVLSDGKEIPGVGVGEGFKKDAGVGEMRVEAELEEVAEQIVETKSFSETTGIVTVKGGTKEGLMHLFCEKNKSHPLHDALKKNDTSCIVCGKVLKTKRNLTRHLKSHQGEISKCPFCRACFKSFERLQKHLQCTHPPPKHSTSQLDVHQFVCEVCGSIFSSKKSVGRHLRRVHSGRTFKCPICTKQLSRAASLKDHLKTHTGEKSWVCEMCGKKFGTLSALQVHKRIHSGVKPYCCDICPKAFSQTSTLVTHRRYHTGERPYSCSFCPKAFVTRTMAKNHERTHI